MSKFKEKKITKVKNLVEEIKTTCEENGSVALMTYDKITANDFNKLRKFARENGVLIKNMPNRLYNITLDKLTKEGFQKPDEKFFNNQNALLIAKDGYSLSEFIIQLKKKSKNLLIQGEVKTQYFFDKNGLLEDVSQLAGSKSATISKILGKILSPGACLQHLLKHLSEKK